MDLLANEKIEFFKDKHPPVQSGYLRIFPLDGQNRHGVQFYPSTPRAGHQPRFVGRRMYYGKNFAEYHQMTTDSLATMIKQAIKNGEVDPSVDVELAVMIMDTWMNAITTYIMKEGMKQKDIMKWSRSAKTQETIDKMLYVMEYGLRKTESAICKSEM